MTDFAGMLEDAAGRLNEAGYVVQDSTPDLLVGQDGSTEPITRPTMLSVSTNEGDATVILLQAVLQDHRSDPTWLVLGVSPDVGQAILDTIWGPEISPG